MEFEGINRGPEVYSLYAEQQKRIKHFSRAFYYIGSCGTAISMSVSSLISPLCYALFGKPAPSKWKLSIDV